jgi:hypothetical protein
MIETFPKEVAKQLGYYVYKLIDPRDGAVFYVGKGKGIEFSPTVKMRSSNLLSRRKKTKKMRCR